VTQGQTFYVTGQYGYYSCLIVELDEEKNFIQSIGTTDSGTKIVTDYEYTVPSGVSYVGFSTRSATTQPLIVKGFAVTEKVFRNIGNDVDVLTEDVKDLKETVAGLESGSGVENLEKEIEKIKTWGIVEKNLYNPEKDTFGKRANDTGNVSLGLRCSEWIAVEPNTNYVLSNNGDTTIAVVIALKNTDDTLSTVESAYNLGGGLGYLIATPETATHIRFSTYTASANDLMRDYVMLEKGSVKTEYQPYKVILDYKNRLPETMQNIWQGRKMVVDGDSITHDWAGWYWQFVASKILGMYIDTSVKSADDDAENGVYGCGWRGIGGSTIADEEQAKINAGMTSNANPLSRSILLRYQNLPDDADIVLIAGGSNDWAHSVIEIGDFDSTDITTFNGALNSLLPGLKTKYPTIPVVMMTPIKRTETYGAENSKGLTLEQFVDAMIAKCRQYGVYCLDMWGTCPINPQIPVMKELLFREDDDTHPNKEGHKVMGKTVAGFVRTLN
jgi:lysophospholipase L1-like esterase